MTDTPRCPGCGHPLDQEKVHSSSCRCGGSGYVERGPSGATYSYPCYSWDGGVQVWPEWSRCDDHCEHGGEQRFLGPPTYTWQYVNRAFPHSPGETVEARGRHPVEVRCPCEAAGRGENDECLFDDPCSIGQSTRALCAVCAKENT